MIGELASSSGKKLQVFPAKQKVSHRVVPALDMNTLTIGPNWFPQLVFRSGTCLDIWIMQRDYDRWKQCCVVDMSVLSLQAIIQSSHTSCLRNVVYALSTRHPLAGSTQSVQSIHHSVDVLSFVFYQLTVECLDLARQEQTGSCISPTLLSWTVVWAGTFGYSNIYFLN